MDREKIQLILYATSKYFFFIQLFDFSQLFEIFDSMQSLSLEKSCLVTKNAINICSAVYCTLGIFGYIAFGSKEISGEL